MIEQDDNFPADGDKNQGEGNYEASKRFNADEKTFIDKNRADLHKLAKEAEAALDGPEGEELRATEADSKARGAGMDKPE